MTKKRKSFWVLAQFWHSSAYRAYLNIYKGTISYVSVIKLHRRRIAPFIRHAALDGLEWLNSQTGCFNSGRRNPSRSRIRRWMSPRASLEFRSWEIFLAIIGKGARGDAVGWGTALQVGRSRVRFPMVSLEFFHWHNPSGRTMAVGLTQPLTEMSTRNISWE